MSNSTKYFFNRSFEILHRKSFDSYRLSLNNPYIIFDELNIVIEKLVKKKVKHFAPTVSEVGCEAFDFLKNDFVGELLNFEPFTKHQIINLLNETCVKSKNENKVRSLALTSKNILNLNSDFKKTLIDRITLLIEEDNDSNFNELDTLTGWLLSQLIYLGFSKTYIEHRIRKCGNIIFKKVILFKININLNNYIISQCFDYSCLFILSFMFLSFSLVGSI